MPSTRNNADAHRDPEDQPGESLEPPAEAGTGTSGGQPTPGPTEVINPARHFAGHLRETIMPLYLSAILGRVMPQIDLMAFKIYRNQFLFDCGNPTDPIECILIDQIVMAHLITGHLQVKGAHESSAESAGVYLGAAARLTGELRRTARALQVFRSAALQLKKAAGAEPTIPGELVCAGDSDTTKECPDSEKEASNRSDDDDGPLTLPLRRTATS